MLVNTNIRFNTSLEQEILLINPEKRHAQTRDGVGSRKHGECKMQIWNKEKRYAHT